MKKLTLIITLSHYLISSLTIAQVAPTPNSPGAGNCLEFDGTNYIKMNSVNYCSSPITVSAWINTNDPNTGNIASYTNAIGYYGWTLMFINGQITFTEVQTDGSSRATVSSGTLINDSRWHHIAATDNGIVISMFVDGILINTVASAGIICDAGMRMYQGIYRPEIAPLHRYNGQIDEVRIWNRARTQTQIRNNMCHTINPASEPNLVGYWQMDAMGSTCGGVTQVCDMTGNGNNGTLN